MGCHALLQGIFPTQGSNPCLLHWWFTTKPPGNLKISCWERLEALTFPLESELHELLLYILKELCLMMASSSVLLDPF